MKSRFHRYFLGLVVLFSSFSIQASLPQKNTRFPIGPDLSVTSGALCDNPDTRRYPEKIAYCNRNVDSSTKWAVIRMYNEKLGYHIEASERSQYKIDHFYPLCAGGSNSAQNLWPQHQTVYVVTDQLEQEVCIKMSEGKMKQAEAIALVRKAKLQLDQASKILSMVRAR
jgi:hypothetical protein